MAPSSRRTSSMARTNVNLYCAQCESQIGIFENEWIRLTSSYARSRDSGTHFGTEVGNRAQMVPRGPAQRSAEGCLMAEVFCRRCSNMVGQYCKSAPDAEKQPLVDQYFYKLSRTYLKDSQTNIRVAPVFGYSSDIVKPSRPGSSVAAQVNTNLESPWANTPLRQSSRTPAVSSSSARRTMSRQESQMSTATVEIPRSCQDSAQNETDKIQQSLLSQKATIQELSGRLSAQESQLNKQNRSLINHDSRIEEQENCMVAQAERIVAQDTLLKEQTKFLQMQSTQLAAMMAQLTSLQKMMNELKSILHVSGQNFPSSSLSSRPSAGGLLSDDAEAIAQTLAEKEKTIQELRTLRAENQAMKSKLTTIAAAMGTSAAALIPEVESTIAGSTYPSQSSRTSRKRKRGETANGNAPRSSGSAVFQEVSVPLMQTGADQMPTPRSSHSAQDSPVQVLSRMDRTAIGQTATGAQRKLVPEREDINVENNASEEGSNVLAGLAGEPASENANHTLADKSSNLTAGNATSKTSSRVARSRASVTASRGRRGSRRGAKSRTSTEIANENTEESIPDTAEQPARRSTRALLKAVRSQNADQLVSHDSDGNREDDDDNGRQSEMPAVSDGDSISLLPTIQTASNVLGMDLELLASTAQTLEQGPRTAQPDTDVSGNHETDEVMRDEDEDKNEDGVHHQSENNDDADRDQFQDRDNILPASGVDSLSNSVSSPEVQLRESTRSRRTARKQTGSDEIETSNKSGYGEIQFIQDPCIYEGIDFSDDDDDLTQANSALYGDDSILNNEGVNELEGHELSSRSQATAPTTLRHGRSMAPEPVKQKRPPTRPSRMRRVNLDTMFMATPDTYSKAILAGEVPKLVRTPVLPTRARLLNEELIRLGLPEWIGKNKKCKEYREAIAAARARSRNSTKAAFLKDRGFNFNENDPSAVLPENSDDYLDDLEESTAGLEPDNIPDAAPNIEIQNPESSTKITPRATRASARRSSIQLVSGLGEAENQQVTLKTKPVRKRNSVGRRGRPRKSNTITGDEAAASSIESAVNVENDASIAIDKDQPVQHEVNGSASSKTPAPVMSPNLQSKPSHQAKKRSSLGIKNVARVSGEKQSSRDSAKGMSLSHDEAIRLRDQMAKEAMERDELDL